jgi:hypothetical protein
VQLINPTDGLVVDVTETNSDGLFRFDVRTGMYIIKIDHEGYYPYVNDVEVDSAMMLQKVRLEGKATLSGFIIHSQTAMGLSGVKLFFRRDNSGSRGESEQAVEFVLTTDDTGHYSVKVCLLVNSLRPQNLVNISQERYRVSN